MIIGGQTLAKMREFLQENKFENIDFLYNIVIYSKTK